MLTSVSCKYFSACLKGETLQIYITLSLQQTHRRCQSNGAVHALYRQETKITTSWLQFAGRLNLKHRTHSISHALRRPEHLNKTVTFCLKSRIKTEHNSLVVKQVNTGRYRALWGLLLFKAECWAVLVTMVAQSQSTSRQRLTILHFLWPSRQGDAVNCYSLRSLLVKSAYHPSSIPADR